MARRPLVRDVTLVAVAAVRRIGSAQIGSALDLYEKSSLISAYTCDVIDFRSGFRSVKAG